MYQDPKRWSYLFQSYVLLTMMELHHKEVVSVCCLLNFYNTYILLGHSYLYVGKKCLQC